MQIIKEIYLDFYNVNYVSVTAKQYDTGRVVSIQIVQNGSIFLIPEGAVAKIASEEVWNNCTLDGNKIIAPLASKLLEKPGTRKCQIELTDGTDKLTTLSFELIVLASDRDDGAIEGENNLNAIDDIIRRGEECIGQINTVTDEVQRKLDNGEFVGSVDPNTTIAFTQAGSRTNITSGEAIKTMFGKISKWFADLGAAAFLGVSNTLAQTEEGYVLDARQGRMLSGKIGNLSSLTTTTQDSAVSAINEVKAKADSNTDDITTLNNNLTSVIKFRSKLYQANINTGSQTTITVDYNTGDVCAFLISVHGASNAAAVSGHLMGGTSAKPTSLSLSNSSSGGVNQWCYAMVGYLYK